MKETEIKLLNKNLDNIWIVLMKIERHLEKIKKVEIDVEYLKDIVELSKAGIKGGKAGEACKLKFLAHGGVLPNTAIIAGDLIWTDYSGNYIGVVDDVNSGGTVAMTFNTNPDKENK